MVKLLVFAILLASSPATGLIEKLFDAEKTCYTDCGSSYPTDTNIDNIVYLDACKKGCNFKLQTPDCPDQCASYSTDPKIRSSCQVGCTLCRLTFDGAVPDKPVLAIDPVQEDKNPGIESASNAESEHPRSIILIRIRQRPSFDVPSIGAPSVQRFFNNDPVQFFNNIVKQFQEKANGFEESIRKSFEQNSKDLPKPSDFGAVSELVKNIPIIRLPGNIRADSSSESSEESNNKRPFIEEFKHVIQHPREHEQYLRERVQPINNRVKQFFTDIRTEWNDLVRKQPKIPIWIFLGILLSSSAILWYMVMSLCRHTPSRRALSIRAQELVFHPYDHDEYEKEKIQPDDQPYEVTESFPIKVKLSNI